MKKAQVPMRKQMSIGSLMLSVVVLVSVAQATQFTITSPSNYARHWDQWLFSYDPGLGWSTQLMGGNADESSGTVKILTDDGSSGHKVDLKLTFDLNVNSYYLPTSHELLFDINTEALNNFAGMSSGLISNSVSIHSDGIVGLSQPIEVARPFMENGIKQLTLVVPFTVGTLPPVDSDPIFMMEYAGHNTFLPLGLQVFDESKSAIFAIQTEVIVTATGAEVINVPDNGYILAMLGSVLVGLLYCRRQNIFDTFER